MLASCCWCRVYMYRLGVVPVETQQLAFLLYNQEDQASSNIRAMSQWDKRIQSGLTIVHSAAIPAELSANVFTLSEHMNSPLIDHDNIGSFCVRTRRIAPTIPQSLFLEIRSKGVLHIPSSRWTDLWFVPSLKPNSSRENPDTTYCVQWCGTPKSAFFRGKCWKRILGRLEPQKMEVWFGFLSGKFQYLSLIVRVWTCKLWSNHLNHSIPQDARARSTFSRAGQSKFGPILMQMCFLAARIRRGNAGWNRQ